MTTAMPKRQEIDSQLTWDTSLIYQNPADYRQALEDYKEMIGQFEAEFKGKLTDSQTIASALKDYEQILIINSRLMHYAFLNLDVDKMNVDLASMANECQLVFAATAPRLSFLETELGLQDDGLLKTVITEQPQWKSFLENILRQKPHQLTADQEELLANFAPTLRQSYDSYETTKFEDMTFADFEANGQSYKNSYVLFENDYEISHDTELRRASAASFYKTLRAYKNTTASAYLAQVKNEQIQAKLRGFD